MLQIFRCQLHETHSETVAPAHMQYLTLEIGRAVGSGHDQERVQSPQRLRGAAGCTERIELDENRREGIVAGFEGQC